jgi:hypothetical protein
MAGIRQYKTVQQPDGKSFVSILKNAAYRDTTRALIWHYPNKWQQNDGPAINYVSAIRQGDWKLVYFLRNGKKELYNLRSDIGETTDLASEYPVIVQRLSGKLGRQLKAWNAPMPVFKASGKQAPFPDEVSATVLK